MTAVIDWVRPWYPGGGAGDHIDPDCPILAEQTSTPVEGSGWLDPNKGLVCPACVPSWEAVCDTCDVSMADDWEDDGDRFTEAAAKNWKSQHRCAPRVRITPPKITPPSRSTQ
ncbi:hypothetical protein HS041_22530 [Planomonospora sp. ID67723]|uniref:hypothetical protein n=1 Tax=Planomonospora sp. ID67723 TaxID=2738134 RepID=UPI0018C3B372|nr:hypothetical protein [Planomonospora sp. ID67723]MBG0830542.1 hypothetical protein [Planomonospora sp. ID67723]